MRRTIFLTVITVALTGMAAAPAMAGTASHGSLGPDAVQECTGTLNGGSYDDLDVPAGATCVLNGVNVQHDLTVNRGATLTATNTTMNNDVVVEARAMQIRDSFISSSITSTDSGSFILLNTNVGHDINVSGTRRATRIGADATCVVDPSVGGSVVLADNHGAVAACNLTIGSTFTATGNTGPLSFFDSFIGGAGVHVNDNSGPAVRIKRLNTGGVIECRENTSKVFRNNNNQAGSFEGQCFR